MKLKLALTAFVLGTLFACESDQEHTRPAQVTAENIKDLKVPANFNFATTQNVEFNINVSGLKGQPLPNKRVNFFTADPDQGGELLASTYTNALGEANTSVLIPAYQSDLFVRVNASGFANSERVQVSNKVNLSFGGKPVGRSFNKGKAAQSGVIPAGGKYYYMGTFSTGSNAGLPSYLEPVGDNLSQQFLDDVDASLPERYDVPNNNPQYLASGNELDVVLSKKSDVWVTFVAEGAGYRNALGYYVFDTDNPPATVNDIDSVFIVLPNASLANSNGALNAGDKVKLGTFEAGKTVSWVLFQNAWDGSGVNLSKPKYYSRSAFNNESDASKKQHTVQLADIGRQLLLNGFEDLTRSTGSDDDFNDLIFYVTANPWEAMDISNVPPTTPKDDDDDDGISNESDDFPNDPSRAVTNNYTGTLAFEDLWPSEGDYDFNDMVVDYSIDQVLNGANKVVEISADWTVRAVGATFANGFGFTLGNLAAGQVSSVSGSDLQEGIISTASNGTETGQSKATVIAFDNVFNIIRSQGGSFVNTIKGNPYVQPATVSNSITFTTPQDQSVIGAPPYNPFIFINGDRGKEVHLSDRAPTDLANQSLFGSSADDSDPASERYYKNANGLPWAINITGSFDYPAEYQPIDDAYNNFSAWAASGGSLFPNWFTDAAGNRNASKLY